MAGRVLVDFHKALLTGTGCDVASERLRVLHIQLNLLEIPPVLKTPKK
jgi:hypothetical protein